MKKIIIILFVLINTLYINAQSIFIERFENRNSLDENLVNYIWSKIYDEIFKIEGIRIEKNTRQNCTYIITGELLKEDNNKIDIIARIIDNQDHTIYETHNLTDENKINEGISYIKENIANAIRSLLQRH